MNEHVYICPKCGLTYHTTAGKKDMSCGDCHISLVETGIDFDEWRSWNRIKKENLKKEVTEKYIQAKQAQKKQEEQRQQYALEKTGLYEYDVVTILNKEHGRIDQNKMYTILNDHARKGWRLHTMYSNELGKNAIMALGLQINSTACEDVLVFERKLEDRIADF